MKRTIIFTGIVAVAIFGACKADPVIYNGDQALALQKKMETVYVNPDAATAATSSIYIGSLKPADTDVKITLEILKTTDPSGQRFTVVSDLNNVVIPQGQTIAPVQIKITNPSIYADNKVDTLKIKVKNAPYQTVFSDSIMTFVIRKFCILDRTLMDGWNGSYIEEGEPGGETMTVTHIGNDTLQITNFWGAGAISVSNAVIKIVIDYSTLGAYRLSIPDIAPNPSWGLPAKLPAAKPGGQYLYTGPEGPAYIFAESPLTSVPASTLDFCTRTISINFARQIPNYGTGGYWYNGYVTLKMIRVGD